MNAVARPLEHDRPLAETTAVHTRILRLALGVEDSRSYWEHVDPAVPEAERAIRAFEQRWFGAKSLERVRFLLAAFEERYDPFTEALWLTSITNST